MRRGVVDLSVYQRITPRRNGPPKGRVDEHVDNPDSMHQLFCADD